MLFENADSYTWVAATIGAENAASYQLPTERSVMPIGGFNGSDPSPTLAQFESYVADGQIHYFIVSTSGPGGGGQEGRRRRFVFVDLHVGQPELHRRRPWVGSRCTTSPFRSAEFRPAG